MHPNAVRKPALLFADCLPAAALLCAFGFALLATSTAMAQIRTTTPTRVYEGQPAVGADVSAPEAPSDTQSIEFEKRLRRINADRQKSLMADTDKLLRLTHELNDELAAQPGDPTPAQLRKIAEIEKLAHDVKVKMSTSVRGLAPYTGPIVPVH
jgi:hypothetical protein